MRKPVDLDTQIKALQDKARSLKERQKTQLGELVLATGADALPLEALAGVLLAAVEEAKDKPQALARWTERGQAFFRGNGRSAGRGKITGAGDAASGASGHGAPAASGRSSTP